MSYRSSERYKSEVYKVAGYFLCSSFFLEIFQTSELLEFDLGLAIRLFIKAIALLIGWNCILLGYEIEYNLKD